MSLATNLPPLAVLFDYDGTLVDTEGYWMRAEIEQLGAFGVPWTMEQAAHLCGTSREFSVKTLYGQMSAHGVDVSQIDDDAFYEFQCQFVIDCVRRDGLPWLPGAKRLLEDLAANQIPGAVVSSSPGHVLEPGLGAFPPGAISVVVDGRMVARNKPDPESYKLAAERLGVDPVDCVVIEDSVSGAAAGLAAGAVVLTVPSRQSVPPRPGQIALPGLEGVDVARLRQLFAQARGAA